MTLPSWFWAWARWRDRGAVGTRPSGIPRLIPAWAWARYKLHRGVRPKPVATPNPFAGIGVFTASGPELALRLEGLVDWVAVKPPDWSDPVGARLNVEKIRKWAKVYVWEADVWTGQPAVAEINADGYIGQAESVSQLAACVRLGADLVVPKAIVGQPYAQPGWTTLLECYAVTVPQGINGYPVVSVYDPYDSEQSHFPLANYLPSLAGRKDFSIYLAERMTDEDIATLRSLRG